MRKTFPSHDTIIPNRALHIYYCILCMRRYFISCYWFCILCYKDLKIRPVPWGFVSCARFKFWWIFCMVSWRQYLSFYLSHWGQVTHIRLSWKFHHSFKWWLVAYWAPSHYQNQCGLTVNCTLRNKLQWNFNRNANIFIQGHAFGNVVCKIVTICLAL